jgi:hypothetical protein
VNWAIFAFDPADPLARTRGNNPVSEPNDGTVIGMYKVDHGMSLSHEFNRNGTVAWDGFDSSSNWTLLLVASTVELNRQ